MVRTSGDPLSIGFRSNQTPEKVQNFNLEAAAIEAITTLERTLLAAELDSDLKSWFKLEFQLELRRLRAH